MYYRPLRGWAAGKHRVLRGHDTVAKESVFMGDVDLSVVESKLPSLVPVQVLVLVLVPVPVRALVPVLLPVLVPFPELVLVLVSVNRCILPSAKLCDDDCSDR
jgi:hypothetical protein